jgi:hypothetical protein
MFQCTLCDQRFENIPASAVKLTRGNIGTHIYRFEDNTIHSLCRVTGQHLDSMEYAKHVRWHENRGIHKPQCRFCIPPEIPPTDECWTHWNKTSPTKKSDCKFCTAATQQVSATKEYENEPA